MMPQSTGMCIETGTPTNDSFRPMGRDLTLTCTPVSSATASASSISSGLMPSSKASMMPCITFETPLGSSLQAESTTDFSSTSESPKRGITCISTSFLLSQMARRFTASLCNFTLRSPSAGSPPFLRHHSEIIEEYGMPLKERLSPVPSL